MTGRIIRLRNHAVTLGCCDHLNLLLRLLFRRWLWWLPSSRQSLPWFLPLASSRPPCEQPFRRRFLSRCLGCFLGRRLGCRLLGCLAGDMVNPFHTSNRT